MNFEKQLDLIFETIEVKVLNEVSIIPPSELDRVLNQSEIKRSISMVDKGKLGGSIDDFIKAIEDKDHDKIRDTLGKIIVGYSVATQFLSQPRNERMKWVKNFLTKVNK